MSNLEASQIKELRNMREGKEAQMPDFEGMTPKEMRRAWAIFLAENDIPEPPDPVYLASEYLRLSIEELILNAGRDAEPTSRRNVRQQFDTFSRLWAERRG